MFRSMDFHFEFVTKFAAMKARKLNERGQFWWVVLHHLVRWVLLATITFNVFIYNRGRSQFSVTFYFVGGVISYFDYLMGEGSKVVEGL